MGEYDGRLMILTTTFPERREAESIVGRLVAEKLVVCGQVAAPLVSHYLWQGQPTRQEEVAVSLKIRDDRLEAALERLRELHPYDVPQLLAWPASKVDERYGRWAWERES